VGTVLNLGITIGRQLNFSTRINNIVSRAAQVFGVLHPIINRHSSIQAKTWLNILKLYVIPVLTYGGAAWAPYTCLSHWHKIEAVQTIGIRVANGLIVSVM